MAYGTQKSATAGGFETRPYGSGCCPDFTATVTAHGKQKTVTAHTKGHKTATATASLPWQAHPSLCGLPSQPNTNASWLDRKSSSSRATNTSSSARRRSWCPKDSTKFYQVVVFTDIFIGAGQQGVAVNLKGNTLIASFPIREIMRALSEVQTTNPKHPTNPTFPRKPQGLYPPRVSPARVALALQTGIYAP